jgi:hypothetical protein
LKTLWAPAVPASRVGSDNWVIGDEPLTAVIWGGWRGWGKPPVGERILTTMLITDIARSTDRAAAVGDAAWDQLLDRHLKGIPAPRRVFLLTAADNDDAGAVRA